ncbi:FecR family protein [Flexithrix dorotheae]|uniref:FecR family protein n=1 Tax=Flexithrix dorotheae TaxID=70993 RepID=UPI00036D79FE|nr:FecR family protein [Flexithrix dorotheae]
MDYKNFDIEDFITEQSFINYYLGTNLTDIEFWEEWVKRNPDKSELIIEAKSRLDDIFIKLPDNEYEEEYSRFQKSIGITNSAPTKINPVVRKMPGWWSLNKVAAVVAFLVVCSLLYFTRNVQDSGKNLAEAELSEPKIIEKFARRGQKNTIVLKDGSKIKLNSGSKIEFPENFGEKTREVFLEGEAFFDVEHDATRPFIVNSGGVRTKVLGTSFNIKNSKTHNKVEVALVTGKVEVFQQVSQEKITLAPHELLEVNSETNRVVKRNFEPGNELGWKDGIIQFKEAKLNEIEEVLESWYDIEIQFKQIPHNKGFTGEFDNESLETVLQGLSYAIGFKFKLEGNKVTIY